jgi:hypothetical protein
MNVKWEYRAIRLVEEKDNVELNQLGLVGWELVSVVHSGEPGTMVAYIKRQIKGGN